MLNIYAQIFIIIIPVVYIILMLPQLSVNIIAVVELPQHTQATITNA